MSKASQLKKKWGHETNIARCETCSHFQPARLFLVDSLPRKGVALCLKGDFTTKANALCDKWLGTDGSTVEATPKPKVTVVWHRKAPRQGQQETNQ